jgi:hypothetical protein
MRSEKSTLGIGRATDPVARMTFLASYSVSPTLTLPSLVREPSPSIFSTLFFFQSISTPSERVFETLARRSWRACQSTVAFSTLTPSSAPLTAAWKRSAEWRIVFAGMQA